MFEQEFQAFKAVADTGNITSAAKRLHMSQPGISLQIQSLESHYGVCLLNRTNKGVTLTRAGSIFYEYVCRMLDMYYSVQQQLKELADEESGIIQLGATMTVGEYVIPEILAYLYEVRPDIDFKVKIANTEVIFQDILEKNIGIGLIEGPVPADKDILIEDFWHDELVVVVPYNHHLGARESLTLQEFAKERLVTREVGSGTRKVMELYLNKRGLNPTQLNIAMELGSTEAVKRVVAAGLGITMISALTVRKECNQKILRTLKIQDETVTRPFSILTNAQCVQSKGGKFFIEFMRNRKLLEEVLRMSQ